METPDPIARIEGLVSELHASMQRELHPAHRKYPLLFLFLITLSVAAIFHGLDRMFASIDFFESYPQLLVLAGMLGLFFTGSLYKRLGKDRFD